MMERSYCSTQSPELHEAEQRCYRAQCYIRCLEANLEKISPEEFEIVMTKLEAAHTEFETAIRELLIARVRQFNNF